MEYVTLANGVQMPILGCGVFQIDPRETERCVLDAIAAGYRSIDTAQGYYNEDGVGAAIAKCGIPRAEIFLTTKIWISNAGYQRAKASIETSLKKLRTDYIDLMLIHQPFGDYYGAYRAMEEAYRDGKLRAIGVSNFMPDRFIDIAGFMDIPPMVNQLETHVFQQQRIARPVLSEFKTQLMAWSPLAQGNNGIFQNNVLNIVVGAVGPCLNFICAGGIIKGLLTLLQMSGLVQAGSGMEALINAAGDAIFFFLPIFLGMNLAKTLKGVSTAQIWSFWA